ncbi:MAG: alkaline phosphatase family protein, partial [Pseudonocardiaceae bacterium]
MRRIRINVAAVVLIVGLGVPTWANGSAVALAEPTHPNRVLIVLFDQMVPGYADRFDMPNFRAVRADGTNFKRAYLGYMASETVMAHNVITSGLMPKHMGWTDEAYRDTLNLFGRGTDAMHITGDLSLADFGTLISHEDYPKLADYLHEAFPGTKFIVVGEKSYAVESAVAPTGDIGVRMSGRSSSTLDACGTMLGGRYRQPSGKNVPAYLLTGPLPAPATCGRYFINSSDTLHYGTRDAFPTWIYP